MIRIDRQKFIKDSLTKVKIQGRIDLTKNLTTIKIILDIYVCIYYLKM